MSKLSGSGNERHFVTLFHRSAQSRLDAERTPGLNLISNEFRTERVETNLSPSSKRTFHPNPLGSVSTQGRLALRLFGYTSMSVRDDSHHSCS